MGTSRENYVKNNEDLKKSAKKLHIHKVLITHSNGSQNLHKYKALRQSVCPLLFSQTQKNTGVGQGANIFYMYVRAIKFCKRGDKHLTSSGGTQTFYVGCGGDYNDVEVDKEIDVSKARQKGQAKVKSIIPNPVF